jgi:DNA-binding MarR family transcriptional regulator
VANDPIGDIQRALILFNRTSRTQAARADAGWSFVVAAMLSYIESSPDPTATDLAELYGLDKSTVSRQLGDLEDQGFVTREPHETRPRTQHLSLTAKGRRALATAVQRHRELIEKNLASWSPDDISRFAALLSRFVGG